MRLVGYGLNALSATGVEFDTDIALGVSILPIVLLVLLAIRRLKRVVIKP